MIRLFYCFNTARCSARLLAPSATNPMRRTIFLYSRVFFRSFEKTLENLETSFRHFIGFLHDCFQDAEMAEIEPESKFYTEEAFFSPKKRACVSVSDHPLEWILMLYKCPLA